MEKKTAKTKDSSTTTAVPIEDMLQEVVKTPEGSTAMFVNFYCTDEKRLGAMKSNPREALCSVFEGKYDRHAMSRIKEEIGEFEINLLQNREDCWHIVLPPRDIEDIRLPDDYLEKISGGELLFYGLTLAFIAGGNAILVNAITWAGFALLAGAGLFAGAVVAGGITAGGLAAAGEL